MTKTKLKPSTVLYPAPVVLVSCGTMERPNIIAIAWTGTTCSDPPMLGIGVRPSRYSYGLIKRSGEFVVNIPTADMVRVADQCGMVSGRDVDKFALTGLTAMPGSVVRAPLIQQCPINVECQVRQILPLGTHDFFIAEIVAVHADENILNSAGKLHFDQITSFTLHSREYRRTGESIGHYGFTAER